MPDIAKNSPNFSAKIKKCCTLQIQMIHEKCSFESFHKKQFVKLCGTRACLPSLRCFPLRILDCSRNAANGAGLRDAVEKMLHQNIGWTALWNKYLQVFPKNFHMKYLRDPRNITTTDLTTPLNTLLSQMQGSYLSRNICSGSCPCASQCEEPWSRGLRCDTWSEGPHH